MVFRRHSHTMRTFNLPASISVGTMGMSSRQDSVLCISAQYDAPFTRLRGAWSSKLTWKRPLPHVVGRGSYCSVAFVSFVFASFPFLYPFPRHVQTHFLADLLCCDLVQRRPRRLQLNSTEFDSIAVEIESRYNRLLRPTKLVNNRASKLQYGRRRPRRERGSK